MKCLQKFIYDLCHDAKLSEPGGTNSRTPVAELAAKSFINTRITRHSEA